jgi:tetratricopeptide (TPR) repeat protein
MNQMVVCKKYSLFITLLVALLSTQISCSSVSETKQEETSENDFWQRVREHQERFIKVPGSVIQPGMQDALSGRRHNPDAYYYFLLSDVLASKGDFSGSLTALRRAVVYDNDSAFLNYKLAEAYRRAGSLNLAAEHCQKALKINPSLMDARILLAGIYQVRGDSQKAIAEYKTVNAQDPDNQEIYLLLGTIYARLKDYKQAQIHYDQFNKIAPDKPYGYYYLARMESERKDLRAAEKYYRKALEIFPQFEKAMLELAQIYEEDGKREKAIETYRKYLSYYPSNSRVREMLARFYYDGEDFEGAVEQFVEIKKSQSGNVDNRARLGQLYLELGEIDKAIEEFLFILGDDPNSEVIRYFLGNAYWRKGNLKQAMVEYRKIKSGSELYTDARVQMAMLLQDQDKVEEALTVVEDTLNEKLEAKETKQAELILLHIVISGINRDMKKYEKAISVLETALTNFPESERILYNLGITYEVAGRTEDSINIMQKVIEKNPNHANALNFLGYTWVDANKNLKKALEMIIKADELSPENGMIIDSLGWAYYRLKKYKSARKQLERAAELVPDDPTILEHLGDVYLKLKLREKALEKYRGALELAHEEDDREKLTEKIKNLVGN